MNVMLRKYYQIPLGVLHIRAYNAFTENSEKVCFIYRVEKYIT